VADGVAQGEIFPEGQDGDDGGGDGDDRGGGEKYETDDDGNENQTLGRRSPTADDPRLRHSIVRATIRNQAWGTLKFLGGGSTAETQERSLAALGMTRFA
jgi:hypothetical protein